MTVLKFAPPNKSDNTGEMPEKESYVNLQPNLNAEIYRDRSVAATLRAPNIEVLKIHIDGTTLVGSCDLTGRYWNGAATINKTPGDAVATYQNPQRPQLELPTGVTDGCFLDSSRIALAEDSGCLSVFTRGSNDSVWLNGKWKLSECVSEHDAGILSMDCLNSPDSAVTGAADGCIKVWNLTDMVASVSYNTAHEHSVNQVAVKPESTSVFVSCSLDKSVAIWDTASAAKERTLATMQCGVCCVCWHSENELLCGDDAGNLVLVDLRGGLGDSSSGVVKQFKEFPTAMRRIVKNPQSNLLGIACESKSVYVGTIDGDNLSIVYKSDSHTDDVRTLCFEPSNPNMLYSGSWDGSIINHNIGLQ